MPRRLTKRSLSRIIGKTRSRPTSISDRPGLPTGLPVEITHSHSRVSLTVMPITKRMRCSGTTVSSWISVYFILHPNLCFRKAPTGSTLRVNGVTRLRRWKMSIFPPTTTSSHSSQEVGNTRHLQCRTNTRMTKATCLPLMPLTGRPRNRSGGMPGF